MKIKFYIEKRKKLAKDQLERERPMLISVCFFGERIKVYTGKKLYLKDWNVDSQEVSSYHPDAVLLNRYISLVKKEIIDLYSKWIVKDSFPDPVKFRKEIREVIRHPVAGFFISYLEFMEVNHRSWSGNTFKKIKTFYHQLREFEQGYGRSLILEDVDQKFADELIAFYKKRNKKDITVKKNLDLLKWFMNWASENKKLTGTSFREIKVKTEKATGEIPVYLFLEELVSLNNLTDLTRKEAIAKDLFCFMSFTGIRYSELTRLKKADCDASKIRITGPGSRQIILNNFSGEIYGKYSNKYYRDGNMFPAMSLVTFHKYLRSASSRAGLARLVPLRGADSDPDLVPIKDCISAGTALNTYIANSLKLAVPSEVVRRYSPGFSLKRQLIINENMDRLEADQLRRYNLLFENIRNNTSFA